MRTLKIDMTQAAFKRLSLLSDVDTLALPLDPDDHAPFGFDFRQRKMFVTFEGKDVGYVPVEMNRHKTSFDFHMDLAPNAVVDKAVLRFFEKITAHLDRVGREMAAQRREGQPVRAQKKETKAEQARRAAQEKARAEAAENQQCYDRMSTYFAPADVMPAGDIKLRDFRHRSYMSAPEDPWTVYTRANAVRISSTKYPSLFLDLVFDHNGDFKACVPASRSVQMMAIDKLMKDNNVVYDADKIIAEVKRLTERHDRVGDPQALLAALQSLPESPYSTERAVTHVSPERPEDVNYDFEVPIDDVFTLKAAYWGLNIIREGCTVMSMNLEFLNWTDKAPADASAQLRITKVFEEHGTPLRGLTPQDRRNIIGVWTGGLIAANPEMDLSFYLKPDPDEIADAFTRIDLGYDL